MIDKATCPGSWTEWSPGDGLDFGERDKRIVRVFPSEKAQNLKKKLIKERERANKELLAGFNKGREDVD